MANIDIPIRADLQDLMKIPPCFDIKLPQPAPMKIQLPTGAALTAVADISKGVPTDCAMAFSLLLQIGPLLASMECLLKILKLLAPLIQVVKGLPFPPVKAISDFAVAAAELGPCLALPLQLKDFIKDILCLILKMLRCLIGGLKSVVDVLGGLQLQLKIAIDEGNTELQKSLECAQENANTSAQHLMSSMEVLAAFLALVQPLMEMAGIEAFKLPAIGAETDVESLKKVLEVLTGVADSLHVITEGLGGCGS